MILCNHCGKELTADANFCYGCGKPLSLPQKNEKGHKKPTLDTNLQKCPKCGNPIDALATSCPACKYELRSTQPTSCVHELAQRIEKSETEEQKIELISNFYIPNTKEDIYEFFILAYSNITAGTFGKEAWSVKLEQAYLKAKFTFGSSEEFTHIKELYENLIKTQNKKSSLHANARKGVALMVPGIIVVIFSLLAEEILNEFNIYMDDGLIPIAILGGVAFIVGLVLFIIPDKKAKNKKR